MSVLAGKENQKKWEEYWSNLRTEGKYLPLKPNGEVNVAQVGRDSRIGRENLYKNPSIYPKLLAAIEETLKAQGEGRINSREPNGSPQPSRRQDDAAQRQIEVRDRRIKQLEEKVAVLTTEIQELRRQIKVLESEKSRYEIIENMIVETGRRILPY